MESRKMPLTLDEETTAIVRRVARRGQGAAFVRRAIAETAARDEQRAEVDELRERLAIIERRLAAIEQRR